MNALLSLDSVAQQMGNKQLFKSLKLAVGESARIGIVGPNGSGKSTLLKIMAGITEPDDGRVVLRGGVRVALVSQIDNFSPGETLLNVILRELKGQLEDDVIEVRAAKILTRLGFDNLDRKVSELSGGWRKRLAIASALCAQPDILLLDEPTNHLDLAGLLWLEQLLLTERFAWVLISHDRYFLEKTVNQLIEVSPRYPNGIFLAEGSYLEFLEARDTYLEQEQSRTASLANKVRNELEWASRGPRGRTTKAVARLKKTYDLHQELREIQERSRIRNFEMSFSESGRQTRELVEFINVTFSFDNREIIKKENFKIIQGTCLGILGQNGQGKSTLLKLIGGELSASQGKIKRAQNLKVVYYDQLRSELKSSLTLQEALSDGQSQVSYQGRSIAINSWAKRFGFEAHSLSHSVVELSGGEQGRLLLSKLVRQEADLLILDEPTNDLDIPMLETLEGMLADFTGAIVLVTHDRFMLEKACTHFFGFDKNNKLVNFASYQQWQDYIFSQEQSGSGEKELKKSSKKLSEAERREYSQITSKITKAENKYNEILNRSADPANHRSHEDSKKISAELAEAKAQIDALYERWSELENNAG